MNGIRDSEFEIRRTSESRIPSRRSLLLLVAIALVFLAVRVALLFARQPFFDEIFTLWMARQPAASVLPNLLHDSGPPLYYWLARFDSVRALRWLSLLFASLQFVLIACRGGNGGAPRAGLLAAALLAVYPPAVLSSVDARAYALCALFVTVGVLAMAAERPFAAAGAFVLAAYSHYYGVLFFPLLLTGVIPERGRTVLHHEDTKGTKEAQSPLWSLRAFVVRRFAPPGLGRRVLAVIVATVAFLPGLVLAMRQPAEATAWNREPLFAPLLNVSWTGVYPESLFVAAPVLLALVATLLLVAAVSRSWHFAPAVLVPLVLVLGFHLAGRPVYFPMRFESVIAGPLALWATASLSAMRPLPRSALAASLALLGLGSTLAAAMSHHARPPEPYRAAAAQLRAHADARSTVVASGFCYLESSVALNRPVIAWPAEQAAHPGWRAAAAGDPRDLPSGGFLWIGERQSAELVRLREARRVHLLFGNERAVIARVEDLTAPLH